MSEPLNKFKITFGGRLRGAIGAFYYFTEEVEAENFDAAILKLYEKYENVHGPRAV